MCIYTYKRTDDQSSDNTLSDNTLIERLFAGDQFAFERLMNRYEKALYNFVNRYLGDYEQTQDVVQFVFLQLYKCLPKLRGNLFSNRSKTPLKSWLFQVAINRCKQELRRDHPLHFSDLEVISDEEMSWIGPDIADPEPLPEELAERHELQRALYAAIRELPPRARTVVLLRYTEDLSFGEIGRRLNMPENTVKSHFYRARQILRPTLARLKE